MVWIQAKSKELQPNFWSEKVAWFEFRSNENKDEKANKYSASALLNEQ